MKYPSTLPNKYYHHSTNKYGKQTFDPREGKKERLHIIGRLTTEKVDCLLVENPNSNNKYPHITLATAKGIKPFESNAEIAKHQDMIQPLDDYVDTTFINNLSRDVSKLIDKKGEPMILYHGTNTEFYTFKQKEGVRYTIGIPIDVKSQGFFLTDDKDLAEDFARSRYRQNNEEGKPQVMDIYVSMKKPADLSELTNESEELFYKIAGFWPAVTMGYETIDKWWQIADDEEIDIDARLKELGYDGIIFAEEIDEDGKTVAKSYFVTNPNQIKSATLNNGEFSLENNDIRFQLANSSSLSPQATAVSERPSQQPIFISNALLAIQKINQQKATPQQWLGMIQNLNGIKPGEDRWTGLSDWLRNNEERLLTKQQVLDYIAEHQIQINETYYMNLEDTPQFANLYDEFVREINNAEDLYDEAFEEYADFLDKMKEKYGQNFDYDHDLTKEEREEGEELLEIRESYNTQKTPSRDTAFNLMAEKYGKNFEEAFDYDGDILFIADENKAAEFLGINVKQIDDTRLRYSTENLDNKKEIALTVPTIESWDPQDYIHFGDADNGRTIAWARFGDATYLARLSEKEIQERIEKRPAADQWIKTENIAGYEYANEMFLDPNNRKNFVYTDEEGKYHIEFNSAPNNWHELDNNQIRAARRVGDTFDTLKEAVAAYDEYIVRCDSRSERVLVIDEIQSKRHQNGREKGYKKESFDSVVKEVADNYSVTEERVRNNPFDVANAIQKYDPELAERLRTAYSDQRSLAAPFENNWHELVMKRMLRYAAENDYDRIAWTTGEQQTNRYDLSKFFDEINVVETMAAEDLNDYFGNDCIKKDGKVMLLSSSMNDNDYSLAVDEEGTIIYCHETEKLEGKKLEQLVGKALADKLLKADHQTFSGENIRIGGEGMTAFYDHIIPNFVNKYAKKWNAHTEDVFLYLLDYHGITMHSVPVTPQMKADVMQGQLMFFLTPQGDAYGFTHNKTIFIDPRIATSETPIHEYAHLWAQAMRQYNQEEWQNIVQLMKQVKPVWEMVQSQYSHLSSDSDIAEEVLAQYSGKQGMKNLEKALKYFNKDLSNQEAQNILERIKAAIDRFWQKTADFLHIHYNSADEVAERVMHDLLNQVNPQLLAQQLNANNGRGDLQSHNQTLKQPHSILAYSTAPYLDVQSLAHGVKDGDTEAIKKAAARIADVINVIPDKQNLVLVPMPSHNGNATYTKVLAEEIAKLTGLTTADVLAAKPYSSLYDFKKENGLQDIPVPAFNIEETLPNGKAPLIIDNVLDTGTTAYAAAHAFGTDTNARIAVLGNTDNFYLFHNGIVLESEKLLDIRYLNAVERGDLETAQQMVNAQAQKMGYSLNDIERDGHSAPCATLYSKDFKNLTLHAENIENGADVNLFAVANGISPQPDDYFTHPMAPRWYMYDDQAGHEAQAAIMSAIRNIQYQTNHGGDVKNMPEVTVFRAVPKEINEDHIRRNGEWVSPSLSYAINHGKHRLGIDNYRIIAEKIPADQLWWDGNDIREWGVDDGRSYAFRNTPNNAKLLDPVTYDDKGNIIPLSQRFNPQNADIHFQLAGQQGAAKLDLIDHKGRIENLHVAREMERANSTPKEIKIATGWERGADHKWRYEMPDAYLNPDSSLAKYADLKTQFIQLNEEGSQRAYRKADRIRQKYLMMTIKEKNIGEIIPKDSEILKAYPDIANIQLKIQEDVYNTMRGYYDENNNTIMLNLSHLKSHDDIRSTLLHEMQHYIQIIEGFAQGANIEQHIPDVVVQDVKENIENLQKQIEIKQQQLEDIHERLPEMKPLLNQVKMAFKEHGVGSPEIIQAMNEVTKFRNLHSEDFNKAQKLNAEIDDAKKEVENLKEYLSENVLGYDNYARMAGETEARNVQKRMLRNPAINARTTAESTEDKSRSEQIVLFPESPTISYSTNEMKDNQRNQMAQNNDIKNQDNTMADNQPDDEIIVTRDNELEAEILAKQVYKNEDNPHVGYSKTISDGGYRGKEHLMRNIFYDDKPIGFATATINTGEGNPFRLLADDAYTESFLLDVLVSSYDRAKDAWEGVGNKELDGWYDHGCLQFDDEQQMIDFYEANKQVIDYRNERSEIIQSLAQTNRDAAEKLSLSLPVNVVSDLIAAKELLNIAQDETQQKSQQTAPQATATPVAPTNLKSVGQQEGDMLPQANAQAEQRVSQQTTVEPSPVLSTPINSKNNTQNPIAMPTQEQQRDFLQDFLNTKTKLQAGKVEQNLAKLTRYELPDGKHQVMTNAEFVQYAIDKDLKVAATPEKGSISESKIDHIQRAFNSANENIVKRNLGSYYKATQEMLNYEQILSKRFSSRDENRPSNAELSRARDEAINSIIDANTPTKMYYHVQYNSEGVSMPISKTMYDYGLFVQQEMVKELSQKVQDFLAQNQDNNIKMRRYEPEIFGQTYPTIPLGDYGESSLFLKDNQLYFTGEYMEKKYDTFFKNLPVEEQLIFLQQAISDIDHIQKEINVHQLMDQLQTDKLDLPEPQNVRLTNDRETSITQVFRYEHGNEEGLNFKDAEGKTIPNGYVSSIMRELLYDMAFSHTTQQQNAIKNNNIDFPDFPMATEEQSQQTQKDFEKAKEEETIRINDGRSELTISVRNFVENPANHEVNFNISYNGETFDLGAEAGSNYLMLFNDNNRIYLLDMTPEDEKNVLEQAIGAINEVIRQNNDQLEIAQKSLVEKMMANDIYDLNIDTSSLLNVHTGDYYEGSEEDVIIPSLIHLNKDSRAMFISEESGMEFSSIDIIGDKAALNFYKEAEAAVDQIIQDKKQAIVLQQQIADFKEATGIQLDVRDGKPYYDGNLYLIKKPIKELPQGLNVNGNLELDSTQIERLPDNLTVKGFLSLGNTPIKELPENLAVGDSLYLYKTNITQLPNDLTVKGNLDLTDTHIQKLPDNLTVEGWLNIKDTPIKELPSDLKANSDLFLIGSQIEKLPDNLTVHGSLYADGSNIKELPENLTVEGTLNVSQTQIEKLPVGLKVKENLDLTNTKVKELPGDLKVKGDIIMNDQTIKASPDILTPDGYIDLQKAGAPIQQDNTSQQETKNEQTQDMQKLKESITSAEKSLSEKMKEMGLQTVPVPDDILLKTNLEYRFNVPDYVEWNRETDTIMPASVRLEDNHIVLTTEIGLEIKDADMVPNMKYVDFLNAVTQALPQIKQEIDAAQNHEADNTVNMAAYSQEEQDLIKMMQMANRTEITFDSDYSITLSDNKLSLVTKDETLPFPNTMPITEMESQAREYAVEAASQQLVNDLKDLFLDTMKDADIKVFEMTQNNIPVVFDISHDDIQVGIGKDAAYTHINELPAVETVEKLTDAISKVDDAYLKAYRNERLSDALEIYGNFAKIINDIPDSTLSQKANDNLEMFKNAATPDDLKKWVADYEKLDENTKNEVNDFLYSYKYENPAQELSTIIQTWLSDEKSTAIDNFTRETAAIKQKIEEDEKALKTALEMREKLSDLMAEHMLMPNGLANVHFEPIEVHPFINDTDENKSITQMMDGVHRDKDGSLQMIGDNVVLNSISEYSPQEQIAILSRALESVENYISRDKDGNDESLNFGNKWQQDDDDDYWDDEEREYVVEKMMEEPIEDYIKEMSHECFMNTMVYGDNYNDIVGPPTSITLENGQTYQMTAIRHDYKTDQFLLLDKNGVFANVNDANREDIEQFLHIADEIDQRISIQNLILKELEKNNTNALVGPDVPTTLNEGQPFNIQAVTYDEDSKKFLIINFDNGDIEDMAKADVLDVQCFVEGSIDLRQQTEMEKTLTKQVTDFLHDTHTAEINGSIALTGEFEGKKLEAVTYTNHLFVSDENGVTPLDNFSSDKKVAILQNAAEIIKEHQQNTKQAAQSNDVKDSIDPNRPIDSYQNQNDQKADAHVAQNVDYAATPLQPVTSQQASASVDLQSTGTEPKDLQSDDKQTTKTSVLDFADFDAQSLTQLMKETNTNNILLPWGDQIRLDENGTLMYHGHNEDATPKVMPFSELSETQQEVFARHGAESLTRNAQLDSYSAAKAEMIQMMEKYGIQEVPVNNITMHYDNGTDFFDLNVVAVRKLDDMYNYDNHPALVVKDDNKLTYDIDDTLIQEQIKVFKNAIETMQLLSNQATNVNWDKNTPIEEILEKQLAILLQKSNSETVELPNGNKANLDVQMTPMFDMVQFKLHDQNGKDISFYDLSDYEKVKILSDFIKAAENQNLAYDTAQKANQAQTNDQETSQQASVAPSIAPADMPSAAQRDGDLESPKQAPNASDGNAWTTNKELSSLPLDVQVERFLGAEMLAPDRDAFLQMIHKDDDIRTQVEEKMTLRVLNNVLVAYAETELQAQEKRVAAMMNALDLERIISWNGTNLVIGQNDEKLSLYKDVNDTEPKVVTDFGTAIARTTFQMAIDDLLPQMEEKVKDLLGDELANQVKVGDIPVKVYTHDENYNYFNTIVIPDKIGLFSNDELYLQDTEGKRHPMNTLDEESRIIVLNDVIKASQMRSQNEDISLTKENENLQHIAMAHETLRKTMRDFGIRDMELPSGDSIELNRGEITLHSHDEKGNPNNSKYESLPENQQSEIYNFVVGEIDKMDIQLTADIMKIAAMMEGQKTNEIAINETVATLYNIPDKHQRRDVVVTNIQMDDNGEIQVKTDENERYPIQALHFTDQKQVVQNTMLTLQANDLQNKTSMDMSLGSAANQTTQGNDVKAPADLQSTGQQARNLQSLTDNQTAKTSLSDAIDSKVQQENEYYDNALAAARDHIENAFPNSWVSLSDPTKHDDTLSVIIDGKDTHITPIVVPMDENEKQVFVFVDQNSENNKEALEMAKKFSEQHPDKLIVGEDAYAFFDIKDALDFQRQVTLIPEVHKLNDLQKLAQDALPFANPEWQRDNNKQIEGAKLMLYGVDSGIRAEYLQVAPYEGQKSELGYAVSKDVNAQNIDSLTELYLKQHPDQQMANNGGEDLSLKFLDVRHALQFQTFVQQLVNAEPKLSDAQNQNIIDIKERYPDTLVINRNGSNYETYGKDAEKLAHLLDIPVNYERGFALAKFDAKDIDNVLPETIAKGQHVTVVDDKELGIRTQAKVINEIGTQLIDMLGEGHHSLIGHPPTEQLPGFHLATKGEQGYMNITALNLSQNKVPTVSLISENQKTTMSLLLLPLDQQQNLLQYAKALDAYQSMQQSIDDHLSQQNSQQNQNPQSLTSTNSMASIDNNVNQDTSQNVGQSVAIPQQQSLEQKATQLINELGLDFTPVALRTPVAIPADLDDWQGQDVVLSHVMLANDKIMVYTDRNDAYDNNNGINISELSAGTQSEILQKLNDQLSDNNQNMTVYVDTKAVPEWAMNALINGDYQGLTDKETQMVKEFTEKYPDHIFSARYEDPSFNHYPAFGEPTDTVDVDIVRIATPDMLRQQNLAEQQSVSQQQPSQQSSQTTDNQSVANPDQQTSQNNDQKAQGNDAKNLNDPNRPKDSYTQADLIPSPLENIKSQFRDSGLKVMPVNFEYDDHRYMDIDGMVRAPFLDFSTKGKHRPETVIAPVSVEYQKETDSLLLHGKNANNDYLTINLDTPTHYNKYAYMVIKEQLEQPLQEAIKHAQMVDYVADESLRNNKASDTFIRNITNSVLHADNGNTIHVGKYDKESNQLQVTENNELQHTVNETWMDPMRLAQMIVQKEAVAVRKYDLAEPSRSYPSLMEVMQKRAEAENSEQARLNEKYLYTRFESKDPDWNEKAIITNVEIDDNKWKPGIRLWADSNLGYFAFYPEEKTKYVQTGNKLDGIIMDISKMGFIDREKAIPLNLLDPISYSRDQGRSMGPDQIKYDGLMVDFGPNHFYFQQILSGPEEDKYNASYEIERLNHGTKEKVVDANIDMVYDRMRRFISDYDLRENQSHSLRQTEEMVKEITSYQPFQYFNLDSHIHNVPTGDENMAIDPRYPIMDVSMIELDREGKIILHGNGGPAPLDSLDNTAQFEVLRRTYNDMMDQELDLPVKKQKLLQIHDDNKYIDIIKPFEHPQNLYDKENQLQMVGAVIIDEQKNIMLFHNVGDADYFLTTKNAEKDTSLYRIDFDDLTPGSQRKILDGSLQFYKSPQAIQQAFREAEEQAEKMGDYKSLWLSGNSQNTEQSVTQPNQQVSQTNDQKAQDKDVADLKDFNSLKTPAEQNVSTQAQAQADRTSDDNKIGDLQTAEIKDKMDRLLQIGQEFIRIREMLNANPQTEQSVIVLQKPFAVQTDENKKEVIQAVVLDPMAPNNDERIKLFKNWDTAYDYPKSHNKQGIDFIPTNGVNNGDLKTVLDNALEKAEKILISFSNNISNTNSEENSMKHDEQKPQVDQQKTDQQQKQDAKQQTVNTTREQATEQIRSAVGENGKVKLTDNERISLETKKGATVNVDSVTVAKNISVNGEVDGKRQNVQAARLTDDSLSKLANHLDELRSAKQTVNAEKTVEQKAENKVEQKNETKTEQKTETKMEQKPEVKVEQKPTQEAQTAQNKQATEQKPAQENLAAPKQEAAIELKPKNIDKVIEVADNAKKANGEEQLTMVRRDNPGNTYFQAFGEDAKKIADVLKQLDGVDKKEPKVIQTDANANMPAISVSQKDMIKVEQAMKDLHIPYNVVDMQGQQAKINTPGPEKVEKPKAEQNTAQATEQKAEKPKERKVEPIEIKPDSKVQVNVVPNKVLDHVYDIQLYIDGQKQATGRHLSIEDRKAFFDKKTPEEKTAFAASLLPKYFEKELAGQKLPDNIERYHKESKQEQKADAKTEQKPAQEQKADKPKEREVKPIEIKPDSKVDINVVTSPDKTKMYLQMYVDGEKPTNGKALSKDDRKAFFEHKTPEEKTAFAASLLPKYFEKELAGQKLPDNIGRYHKEGKQEQASQQKAAEQKPAQEQKADAKTEQKTAPKISAQDIFAVWQKASNDEKTILVQRQNNKGDNFYTAFNKDAEKLGKMLERTPKDANIEKAPDTKYITLNQKEVEKVWKDLVKQGGQPISVNMDGKYARVFPSAQEKSNAQANDLAKYNVPEGKQVTDVKVWQYKNEAYMNGKVNGTKLDEKKISQEDYKAFQSQKAKPENLVAKYYSPAEMQPKQEVKQTKGMSR